ncbi:hypothetical protein [Acidimangrovimonas pyrenivorans]|uniref:Response regulatory domain-containing protein n=1 Tax=Acidimangrovimonas pyrenivorans TaxID=2030798 RepID=A0ABV7ALB1_9RHOB
MSILIVESDPERGPCWQRHVEAEGQTVRLVATQAAAVATLKTVDVRLIVLNLDLAGGGALAVADFAHYRQPDARVIFVTGRGLFADGSIFAHAANACAFLPADTAPADLAAMVSHYASAG